MDENKTAPFIPTILKECTANQISYDLIRAIITHESSWNPKAMRFEKGFTWYSGVEKFAKIQGISVDTERYLQKFSFGLGQLMGGTARDIGFAGKLVDLLDPDTNIYWTCKYFKLRCQKYVYDNDKIAAYNAGSVMRNADGTYANQAYVDAILKELAAIQNKSPKVFQPH